MNIVLWILQVLVALAFLAAGSMKTFLPIEQVRKNQTWARHVPAPVVRLVGILEILGALGLILPAATHILPWLTPVAAIGLVCTMIGALTVHIRLKETAPSLLSPVLLLLLLALLIVIGRFVVVPIS